MRYRRWLLAACFTAGLGAFTVGCGPAPYTLEGFEPHRVERVERPTRFEEEVAVEAEPPRAQAGPRTFEVDPLPRGDADAEGGAVGRFAPGQVWTGRYTCSQGPTRVDLVIVDTAGDRVRAIFDFRHKPSRVRGAYVIDGVLDRESGEVLFAAREWLSKPEGYITTDMHGAFVSDEDRWVGRIDSASCGGIDVQLSKRRALAD